MTRTRALTLLSVLLLAGCPTRPDDGVQVVGPRTPATPTDGGTDTGTSKGATPTADGGAQTGAATTLRITSPASNVSTNGTVSIAVAVDSGNAPATIQLMVDGTALTTLGAPAPYHYSWDTTGVADGPHALVAQATVAGQLIASPPVSVFVDRTAPTIASTVPATGAVNVALRAPISVKFSEPILASSFAASSISLLVGISPVASTATLSADGLSATVVIDDFSSLPLPATFSVKLAPTITDLVGNPIKAPATVWSWGVPSWIKYAPVATTTFPALAVGPNFQPTLAYTRCLTAAGASSCTDDMFVAASDGQAWNSLGQVPALIGPGSLDLDSQGNPIVAGVGAPATAGSIVSVRLASWSGSTWDASIAPLPIATFSTSFANPNVRLDPSGHPVVAWKEGVRAVDADIGVARWTGTAWDQSFGKFSTTYVDSAALILDGNGNPIVGFSEGSILNLFTSSSCRVWNGASWTTAASNPGIAPYVALDAGMQPMMLASSTVEHYADGTWLPAVAASIPYSAAAGDVHLTTGPDHQPVVAWLDLSATYELGLARWTGSSWDARAGLFNAGGTVGAESPGVLVDGRGSVWVYWREGSVANVWMSNY